MKKRGYKCLSMLCMLVFMLGSVAYADETQVIKYVAGDFIKYISWFGYAIALGVLIFIGIKYAMSPANERANLKRMFPAFLVGFFILVFGLTIARMVVEIAGNEGADQIIDVGKSAGDHLGGQ